MWEESGRGGSDKLLPVVTISFCWDSREHPDPKAGRGGKRGTSWAPHCMMLPASEQEGLLALSWVGASIERHSWRCCVPGATAETSTRLFGSLRQVADSCQKDRRAC